jgi:hypothetical protein
MYTGYMDHMHGFEGGGNERKEAIKPVDCMVLLGHSVEEVTTHSGNKTWKPTALIQKRVEEDPGKWFRTGDRDPHMMADHEEAYVGGGNAVTLAGAEMYDELREAGSIPKLVIFAAGRAFYLKKKGTPEGFSEGIPMKEVFDRKARISEEQETIILGENKQTKDDIEGPLRIALERGYKSLAFLMLRMRIERAHAFYEKALDDQPEYRSIDTSFIAAEDLLVERYKDHPELLSKILKEFEDSTAFKKTAEDEKGGTDALRSGQYKGKGNY